MFSSKTLGKGVWGGGANIHNVNILICKFLGCWFVAPSSLSMLAHPNIVSTISQHMEDSASRELKFGI